MKHFTRRKFDFRCAISACERCSLVQTEDFAQAETLFKADYAYFSSTSETWLKHASQYTSEMIARLLLTENNFVIEIASNDGYLLKNFVAAGIPCPRHRTDSRDRLLRLNGLVFRFDGNFLVNRLGGSLRLKANRRI